MRKVASVLGFVVFASATTQAADFSIGLSNETAAVDFTSAAIGNGLEFTVGGLHHVDNGNMASAGLQVSQQVNKSFKASVGGKVVGVFNDYKNSTALALGGAVDVEVPNIPKLHIGAQAWLAPAVTSSHDTRNYQDLSVSVGYRLLNNAEVYAAYRNVSIDYDKKANLDIYDGPVFGLKMFF